MMEWEAWKTYVSKISFTMVCSSGQVRVTRDHRLQSIAYPAIREDLGGHCELAFNVNRGRWPGSSDRWCDGDCDGRPVVVVSKATAMIWESPTDTAVVVTMSTSATWSRDLKMIIVGLYGKISPNQNSPNKSASKTMRCCVFRLISTNKGINKKLAPTNRVYLTSKLLHHHMWQNRFPVTIIHIEGRAISEIFDDSLSYTNTSVTRCPVCLGCSHPRFPIETKRWTLRCKVQVHLRRSSRQNEGNTLKHELRNAPGIVSLCTIQRDRYDHTTLSLDYRKSMSKIYCNMKVSYPDWLQE